MKVSIITVSYNRVATIAAAIESVLMQNYPFIEYIVIDGNSTDGTQDVIRRYRDKIDVLIIENDRGMYDALNKGIRAASGDIIGILHSDDQFFHQRVISMVVQAFELNTYINAVYGNGVYVSNDDKLTIKRKRICGEFEQQKLCKGWLPLHTAVFFKRILFDQFGDYATCFKIAADTELMLRFFYVYKVRPYYLNAILVRMRVGGFSTSPKYALLSLKEDLRIYLMYGLPVIKAVFLKKANTLLAYLQVKIDKAYS